MIILYNAISSDGYIAAGDGTEDFIPYDAWYDFVELCGHYDLVVMGKNSYSAIQGYESKERELFEKLLIKKLIVSRDENFIPKKGYGVVKSTKEVLLSGKKILLSSGPSLNDVFLEKKLIDKIILNILPVEVREGVKQFNKKQPKMILKSEEHLHEGRILRTYDVIN